MAPKKPGPDTPSSTSSSNGARKKTRKINALVINPDENWFLRKWDMVTATALLFVCFVSPYEVAFLTKEKTMDQSLADPLFFINRFVDGIFIIDMCLQFFIMYPVTTASGVVWITDHKHIIRHYLKSWFVIDVVSVAPFDFLGLMFESDDLKQLKVLRVIRLLRLLKLARLFRGMRILQRWASEVTFSYRKLTLYQLVIIVVVLTHWISCIFGIIETLEGETCVEGFDYPEGCAFTWLSPEAQKYHRQGKNLTPLRTYSVALYAASTVIVHPHTYAAQNEVERLIFVFIIFVGGFCWTRVISKTTAIQTSMDKHNIFYHQTMDDLNHIAADMNLSFILRKRLRLFFMNTKDSSIKSTWKTLMERMSPHLRNDVAYACNKIWIRRIPYLANASRFLMRDVTMALKQQLIAQQETFGEPFTLYILNKGICSWCKNHKMVILTPGSVWGEEHLFLTNYDLLLPNTATSTTFSELVFMTRDIFWKIVEDHPDYHKTFRRFKIFYAMVRTILHHAQTGKREEIEKLREEDRQRRLSERRDSKGSGNPEIEETAMDLEHAQAHADRARRSMRKSLTGTSPAGGSPGISLSTEFGMLTTPQIKAELSAEEMPATVSAVKELEKKMNDRLDDIADRSARFEGFMRDELNGLKRLIVDEFQKSRSGTMQMRSKGPCEMNGAGCSPFAIQK